MRPLTELRTLITDHWTSERPRFVLWVPVIFAIGIGAYFALSTEPPLAWGVSAALASLFFTLLLWKRHAALRLLGIAALLASCGFALAAWHTHVSYAPMLRKTLYPRLVEGRVDDIQLREKGQRIILSGVSIEGVKQETGPQRLSVSLREINPDLHIGDRVRVKAMLFPPPGPSMPGGYDFARGFFFDGLGAVGFANKMPEITERGDVNNFTERLNALRHTLVGRITGAMSERSGPVAAALMVGEMSGVPEEVRDSMRDSGLYHVLSISGLHMSLAAGLLYGAVRLLLSLFPSFALRWPVKKIAAIAGLLGAFAYLLLAGYPVPAVRSFVMVACVMVAVLLDRRGISMVSLAWAAMLILIAQPDALLGASFELSFAATVGILALYERFGAVLYKSNATLVQRLWLYLFGLVATSLVATLATTPLVIYHFNRFTLWGIIANMLMIPLASLWIMPMAILAFFAMPLGVEHGPLALLDLGIGWMLSISDTFAHMPHAAFSVPSPTFWGLLLIVFGGLWLCLWQRNWRLLGIPAILIGMSTITLHQPYDLLVDDEGTKIALRREDGEFLFIRGKPDSFEAQQWLMSHGLESGLTLKDVPDAPACDKMRCIIESRGHRIIVAKRVRAENLCEGVADIVIAPDYLDKDCDHIPLRIDRDFLGKSGAVGLRFKDGIEIDTAARHRGRRPWVPLGNSRLQSPSSP